MNNVERTVAKTACLGLLLWQAPAAVGLMVAGNAILRAKARRNIRGAERRVIFAGVNSLMCAAAAVATPAMAGIPIAVMTVAVMTWAFGGSSHLPPTTWRRTRPSEQDGPVIDAEFCDSGDK